MEKYNIIKMTKKISHLFKNLSPTGVYNKFLSENTFRYLVDSFNERNLLFLCFLIPRFNKNFNIEEDYDNIELNLFSVITGEIYNENVPVECHKCKGYGEYRCDNCGGFGCDICNQTGDKICDVCDGSGSLKNIFDIEMTKTSFVSWNDNWKMFFFSHKENSEVDYYDFNNFINNNKTITLNYFDLIVDYEDYSQYDEGDILFQKVDENPKFRRMLNKIYLY